jgi:hypothetical protein
MVESAENMIAIETTQAGSTSVLGKDHGVESRDRDESQMSTRLHHGPAKDLAVHPQSGSDTETAGALEDRCKDVELLGSWGLK